MKTYFIVVLLGLFGLFGSTAAFAHGTGSGAYYPVSPVTGGITIWGGSNGHIGYAGNLTLGFGGGYAPVPYYGYGYAPGYRHNRPYWHRQHGGHHGGHYGRNGGRHGGGYGSGHGSGHDGGHGGGHGNGHN